MSRIAKKSMQALKQVLVNLVDLVVYLHSSNANDSDSSDDSQNTRIPVRQFATMREFRKYTQQQGKTYNKAHAKSQGFLKVLLREVHGGGR
jgi:hypothetical protein